MKFDDDIFNESVSNDEYNIEDVSSNDNDDVFDLNAFANMKIDSSEVKRENRSRGQSKKKGFFKSLFNSDGDGSSDRKKNILKIVLSCFLIFVITGCIVVGAFLVYVFGFVDASIDEDLNDLSLNFTTTIYVKDKDADTFSEYQRLHGEYNRIWVAYNKAKATNNDPEYKGIPQNLANAFVAIEDKRFADHDGVDWKRTFSAFANVFLHFSDNNYGGSTLTQQLVKNLTGDNSKDALRKVREIMRARYLEDSYSKETIIECYMNTVAMGKGMYGVEVASNYYFGKSVNELTLTECASLAAIVKGPSIYRPDKNPINNEKRRNTVLDEMYDQGFITKEECEQAKKAEFKVVADETALKENEINNYFVDALIDEVISDIATKYNYDKSRASLNFYNGGYKIYCTMDPDVQKAVDTTFTDPSVIKKSNKTGKQLQGAITVMDYKGHIVGLAGGIGEKTVNRGLNRAFTQPRQPGSSIKPLAAYSLALENNLITYSSHVNDVTQKYGTWTVKGSSGYVTVANAVERSLNTIPVQLINKMTPQASLDFLIEKLGMKHLDRMNDLNLASLGLGGCYYGFTTTEEAAAYQIFGNGGTYYKPSTYYYITDQHGKIILDNRDYEGEAVISEDTSVIMNKLLQNVVYGGSGTARSAAGYVPHMRVFGKTGTTNSTTNKWFVGGSPYYVASCWVGYDLEEQIADNTLAIKLWGGVMSKINADKKAIEFPTSEYVVCRNYCTHTGLLAKTGCESTAVGWYKTSYLPVCTSHGGNENTTDPNKVPSSSAPTSSSAPVSSTPETPVSSSETATSSETVSSQETTSSATGETQTEN